MRVNQPQARINQQRTQRQTQPINVQSHSTVRETEVMQLARKIKSEQGGVTAGYFLFAMKPFIAPNEIAFIERELKIKCQCDPRFLNTCNKQGNFQRGGLNSQMLQMLMNMMGGRIDPMTLMKMMNKGNNA